MKTLEAYAFEKCDKLQPTGSGCFKDINPECVLYVPRGAKNKYKNTLGWDSLTRILETDTP